MSRGNFLKPVSLLYLGILANPMYGSAFSFETNNDVIIGHNSHRYKVDINWGSLNFQKNPVKECCEIIQGSKGRLIKTWSNDYPKGHGLTLVKENEEDFLLITD